MSRLTRVIAIALMSVMIISTVTSCTLMSKNRIIKYAEQNIGECKVISEEHDGNLSRTVYLKDKDTGIKYSVTCKKRGENDNAPSDIVLPYTTKNDFFEKYYEYLLDEAYKELKEFSMENNVDVKGKRINFYKIIDKDGTCLASYNSAKDSTTYFKNNTED